MKIIFLVYFVVAVVRADEEFFEFEQSVFPEGISAFHSSVSLDTCHRYRGNQSLKWDWKSGATLRIDCPIECDPKYDRREDGFLKTRSFKFWIYSETALPNKRLNIVFGDTLGDVCSFPFYLNFTGWRTAWVSFARDMKGKPDRNLTYIRFEAPRGEGCFWLDDIAPVLSIDIRHAAPDYQVPFINATRQSLRTAPPHEANILIDQKIHPAGRTKFVPNVGDQVEARLKKMYPPKKQNVETLASAFNQYHIQKDATGVIRGDFLLHLSSDAHVAGFPKQFYPQIIAMAQKHDFETYTRLMLDMARAYTYWEGCEDGQVQADVLKKMFLLMSRHLLDQGWQAGSSQGATHHFGYSSATWPPAIFLMQRELAEVHLLQPMADSLIWFFNVKKHFLPPTDGMNNMDYLNTTIFSELLSIAALPDTEEKQAYFSAFQTSVSKILALNSAGSQGGIKTDGSLFHHRMHYAGYGVPAICGAARLITTLDGTCYELTSAAYNNIKHAFLAARLWGYPFGGFNACGRHPLLSDSRRFSAVMQNLAKAAPSTDSFDPELAAAWLDMEGGDSFVHFGLEIKPDHPQGGWAMNYQSGGVYKWKNRTVLLKGYGCGVRSHETYKHDNRYGRYGSHGTIQIFENTRKHFSGFENPGWIWSQPPGATTLMLPLDLLEGNKSFYGFSPAQFSPFAGAGELDPKKKKDEQAICLRKSVVCIDGKLICIGSNLSSSSEFPLVTTLFQTALRKKYDQVQQGKNWIIDPYQTGYWIDAGVDLQIQKGMQHSRHNKTCKPTKGEFARAWINHGKQADQASYRYVAVLNANPQKMKEFIQSMESDHPFFYVKRQDAATHALYFPQQKVWSIVNFAPLKKPLGLLLSIDQPCLILVQQKSEHHIRLSVTDPRLNLKATTTAPPVEIKIQLKGKFRLSGKPPTDVVVNMESSSTYLRVTCAEGRPTILDLIF